MGEIQPDYIFFPHWSWIIPEVIYKKYTCIVFHSADLPYGRGGSPIQNQIIRGIRKSKVCAIKCVKELDAGDIYCKEDIDLGKGNIDEILMEISNIIFLKLIPFILDNDPTPVKQDGKLLQFKRRNPKESNINLNEINDISQFYDFIRMLDGEGYPRANIILKKFRIEFSNVSKRSNYLEGIFKIYEK